MIDSKLNREIGRELNSFNRKRTSIALLSLVFIVAILSGIYIFKPDVTGFITLNEEFDYTENVNLEFNESSEYIWNIKNPGDLKNIKINGRKSKQGSAKVYIENNGIKYLIFDSDKLVEKESGIFSITGLVVLDNETINNDSIENKTIIDELNNNIDTEIINETIVNDNELNNDLIENIETINESNNIVDNETIINQTIINKTLEKSITLDFNYGDNEFYDTNNDGTESLEGIIDFTPKAEFNWNVNENNLCTRYEVYSIDDQESTSLCHGNNVCCAFIELQNSRASWNESLFLSYGSYGSDNDNIVSSQVIYVDYNLELEEPYVDIAYSSWNNLTAKFVKDTIEFEDVCVDTCVISKFNSTEYKLIIEIDNTTLNIDDIKYTIQEVISTEDPVLLKNIENISLIENEDYTLDLSKYFSDDDILSYSYFEMDNVTINIEDNIAQIIPDKGFSGNRFTFIAANDSLSTVSSNIFKIAVNASAPRIQLGSPVKWVETITLNETKDSINITIPKTASNITIKTIINNTEKTLSKEKIKIVDNGKEKTVDEFEKSKEIERVERKAAILEEAKKEQAIKVVIENEEIEKEAIEDKIKEFKEKETELEKELEQIETGEVNLISGAVVAQVEEVSEIVENETTLIINEAAEEVTIEYITEPPYAIEKELSSDRKQIKIISETSYENVLAFTDIKESNKDSIKLYWIQNDTRQEFTDIDYLDTNLNGLVDRLEWVVPHLSNQTFEIELTILNVQSYPTVGGNWTIEFNTTGTGNLTIKASNGTTWNLNNESEDLRFLDIKCDNNSLDYNWTNNALFIEDYNCNLTSSHTVKVLTPGTHTQQFNFSGQVAYANNFASVKNVTVPDNQFIDGADTDFNKGVYNRTNVTGTGNDANITLYKENFYEILVDLGLDDDLKLVLDTGANASYNGTLQTWYDLSNNGGNFSLGATGSSEGSDPAFNGNPGELTNAEYFSSDGGDFFQFNDSSNKDWMNDLHKNNANFTLMYWVYPVAGADHVSIFSTGNLDSVSDGVDILLTAPEKMSVFVDAHSQAAEALQVTSDAAVSLSQWVLLGYSIDEAKGANGGFFYESGSYKQVSSSDTFDATYTTPATGAATYTARIGHRGGGTGSPFNSGTRLGGVMVWNGTALTKAQMDEIYERTKERFLGGGESYAAKGNFTSQAFNTNKTVNWTTISWENVTPVNTNLTLFTRTSVDNSTWTAWTQQADDLSAITQNSENRYLQYLAKLNTSNTSLTPKLLNVSINYSLLSNLSIWDDTDSNTIIVNELNTFYANFTDTVDTINGSNVWCTLSHNGTGNWGTALNMSFNSTTGLYFHNLSLGSPTVDASKFNITCDATTLGYNLVNVLDEFIVYSLNITVNLNVTSTTASQPIAVSGHINLSNGTNVSNTNITVHINNVNITNATTNSFGNYNVTITANATNNTYTLKVNTTWNNLISGENSITFEVLKFSTFSKFNGETTNFNTTPDLNNVSDAILEILNKGRINFLNDINASSVDFDSHVNISNNFVRVNTSAMNPSINTSANISLYNVSVDNPVVYVDPEEDGTFTICLPSDCELISNIQSGDEHNITFNVTHFSSHKIINASNLTTIPTYPRKDQNVTFLVNVSPDGINSVNFTVIDSDGSKVIDNKNGSYNGGNFWNVTYNISSYGTWLWNASIFYDNGFITNSSTQEIILMEINLTLNSTLVPASAPVAVSGHINLSNNTNVSNTNITVFIDNVNVTNASTDTFGNYNVTINANSTPGDYTIKVNATTDTGIPGERFTTFTVDSTAPIVNTSINNTSPKINEIVNLTANVTDNTGLSTGQIIINDTGIIRYFNFSLSGTSSTFSQNITISSVRGNVINFTARVNDTTNNSKTNDTIITITNTPAPSATIIFPTENLYTNLQPLDLNVTFTPDPDKDVINTTYYINGVYNQSIIGNATFNASDGYYILNVSLFDNVTGAAYSDNVTVNFTVDTTPVALRNVSFSLTTITIGDKLNLTINASESTSYIETIRFNFTDPNNDNFSRVNPTHFAIASQPKNIILNYTFFSGSETSVVGIWNLTYVSLTDAGGNVIAQLPNITFEVEEKPVVTVTETETVAAAAGSGGSSGGGGLTTGIGALDIIVAPQISLNTKDTITAPVLLRNTGDLTLNDISLRSEVDNEGITIYIDNASIDSLSKNQTATRQITITTDVETLTKFKAGIIASVKSPKLEERVDFIIDALDVYSENVTNVEEQLEFAQSLFEKDQQCNEFNNLLSEARAALETKEFKKALVLIDSAVEACSKIIGDEKTLPTTARPSKQIGFKITVPMLIVTLILVLAVISFMVGRDHTKIRIKIPKKKRKQKIGPTKAELKSFADEEKEIENMLERGGL